MLGFEILDGMFPFTERKISFISIWFSAAIGMFLANKLVEISFNYVKPVYF